MKLIEADKAIQLMEVEITKELSKLRKDNPVDDAYRVFLEAHREMFKEIIESCPEVNRVARTKGRWLYFPESFLREAHYTCSICGESITTHGLRDEKPEECPHCHSEMEV